MSEEKLQIEVEDRLDLIRGPSSVTPGEETEYFPAWQVVACVFNTRDAIASAPDGEISKEEVANIFHQFGMSLVEHIQRNLEAEDEWEPMT